MGRPEALVAISVRTHVLAALSGILPLVNAAANWANVRPILEGLVEIAAGTLAQVIALQRLESGGSGGPGTPPRPVRQGSGALVVSSPVPPGSDPILMPALAGMLQVCLRAIRHVVVSNGALTLTGVPGAAASDTVARFLTCRSPLLATLQAILVQLSPRSDALRVSALGLLDALVVAGEAGPLATHSGLVTCLQSALTSEELQGRASAVIVRLASHPQAREYVGSLVSSGLVTVLTATLASVRHPDDVIVETYATLQRVYDFCFIRDVTHALGAHEEGGKMADADPPAKRPPAHPHPRCLAGCRHHPDPRAPALRRRAQRRSVIRSAAAGPHRAAGAGGLCAAARGDVWPLARGRAPDGAECVAP